MDDSPPQTEHPSSHSASRGIGPTVAIGIVILLMAAGALYFFAKEHERLNAPPVQETINA